jgi:hypothetical protein
MNYQTKKETVLPPIETTMNIEAWIIDSKYVDTPNRDGEFEFTFQPYVQTDYGYLKEVVMSALRTVDMSAPYVNSTDLTETKSGLFKCSQLFQPKLNKELMCPEMELQNKQVSLKLHLRDDVAARIFLQCDYIDMYEEDTRTQYEIECEENPLPPYDIDF